MRQFSMLFIMLILLCALISCEKDEEIDIIPISIIDSHIYTTEIQELFETPHYAVFAVVHCEVHGGYARYSQYKTEYPLETPAKDICRTPYIQ